MKAEWEILLGQWLSGVRTRDAALRLTFLCWYSCIEPPHLTGLEGLAAPAGLIDELFEFLGGEESADAEFLFVVGVMASVAPWCLGDVGRWDEIADRFRARLAGHVPAANVFIGRGGYGEYFEGQALASSRDAT